MGCGSSVPIGDEPANDAKGKPKPAAAKPATKIPGVLPNMHELLEGARRPQADCILPLLYLGNMTMANDLTRLTDLGVRRIVNVTQYQPRHPTDFVYESIGIEDTHQADIRPHLKSAAKFIATGLSNGEPVFVHCEMGMSRSSSVIIAFLLHERGWTVRRAYLQVKISRPIARITKTFLFALFDEEMKLAANGDLDEELLIEEGLESAGSATGADSMHVTAAAMQLFFFPTEEVVRGNLDDTGLLPPEWDTFKLKFLSGVSASDFERQANPPPIDEICDALRASASSRSAFFALRKRYPDFVSPFVK
ncbi:Dual specificity protein phosphatase 1 [Diplonema papillatum]|nr:Dual specificity protein phosphatase 1 [Diplonema papillatum]